MHWGPKKIRELYAQHQPHEHLPSRSTVERVLQKAGFVATGKRRRHVNLERIQEKKLEVTGPNDLWTVDFKGWWYTSTNEKGEPLTVRDEWSKYICAMFILGTHLAAWWFLLGFRLHRIDPGSSQQNGAHERMHLDMKKELEGQIVGDLGKHQKTFNLWRHEFNTERPHEALGMKTPAMLYVESERTYAHACLEWDYPSGYGCRRVNDRGYFNFRGHKIFITNALGGYRIGIKSKSKLAAEVWFFKNLLGEIDLQDFVFKSILDN